MIGTELLLGQIEDSNAGYMARTLAEHGIHLYQKTTVGDNRQRIRAALESALARADVVLCSGGLGPTEDDITRECVAEVFGRELVYHEPLFEAIRERFAHFGRSITENNGKQALLPEGAQAIENPHGTAPGVLLEDARGTVVCMPGVPSELRPMLEERVLPHLRRKFGVSGVLAHRVLKVCGMGESRVDSLIRDIIAGQANPTVGLLASPGVVRIRITAHAETSEAAGAQIAPVEARIRERLGDMVMGADDETLEGVVAQLLADRGWTLAVGEAQTGGMIAQMLVSAGADRFAGGRVEPGRRLRGSGFALDWAAGILLDYQTSCAIAAAPDDAGERSWAALVTPLSETVEEIGGASASGKDALRTSVMVLEHFRRLLLRE